MTAVGSRNGYTRLPTADPDQYVEGVGAVGDYGGIQYGLHRDWDSLEAKGKKKPPPSANYRPGLFHMFGDRWKYAANHVSVALASQTESEQEAEKIELTDFRSKRPKYRRTRVKSNSKSPRTPKQKSKFKFNTIEEPILPGDTLQRVALRYGCPVSEIALYANILW